MIEIKFTINGRPVRPNSIRDAIEKAAYDSITKLIKSKVGSIRCSKHGGHPRVTVKGRSLNELSFQVEGCCQELIDNTRRLLS